MRFLKHLSCALLFVIFSFPRVSEADPKVKVKEIILAQQQILQRIEAEPLGLPYEKVLESKGLKDTYHKHKGDFAGIVREMATREVDHKTELVKRQQVIDDFKTKLDGLIKKQTNFQWLTGGTQEVADLQKKVKELENDVKQIQADHHDDIEAFEMQLEAKKDELDALEKEKLAKASDLHRQVFKTIQLTTKQLEKILTSQNNCVDCESAPPDTLYENGTTALMIAAENMDAFDPALPTLAAHLGNINFKDNDGKTALRHAIDEDNAYMVNWLLMHGALPDIADNKGASPWKAAFEKAKEWGSDYIKTARRKEILTNLIEIDPSPELRYFKEMLHYSEADQSFAVSILQPIRKDLRGLPSKGEAIRKIYREHVSHLLGRGDLQAVRTMHADSELKVPKQLSDNVNAFLGKREAEKAYGSVLQTSLITDEEYKAKAIARERDYGDQLGILLSALIPIGKASMRWSQHYWEDKRVLSLIDALIELPETNLEVNIDGKQLIDQAIDRVDASLVSKILKKISPPSRIKENTILSKPTLDVFAAVFSHPAFSGEGGDSLIINNKQVSTLGYLAVHNPFLIRTFLETRDKIVLPKDVSFIDEVNEERERPSIPDFLRSVIQAKVSENELDVFIKKLPSGLLNESSRGNLGTILDYVNERSPEYRNVLIRNGAKTVFEVK